MMSYDEENALLREADAVGYRANMAADYGNHDAAEELGKEAAKLRRRAQEIADRRNPPPPRQEQQPQNAAPSPQPREAERAEYAPASKPEKIKKEKKKGKGKKGKGWKEGAASGVAQGTTQWILDRIKDLF